MLCAPFAIACLVAFTPPKEFDYEPKAYYVVADLPTSEVSKFCFKPALACTKNRVIALSTSLHGDVRKAILRHEKAHLNGWVH